MKKCPYCSESIQDDAKKCRHCGEWLEGTMVDIKKELVPGSISRFWKKIRNFFVVIILLVIIFLTFGSIIAYKQHEKDNLIKAECLIGRNPEFGKVVFNKEYLQMKFKDDKCSDEDLNPDFKQTKMDERVLRCRGYKQDMDTSDYNQCLKEKR